MLINKRQKNLKALASEIRHSRLQLASRSTSRRIALNGVKGKSALTNPVIWMPLLAGVALTSYKRGGFAGTKTLRLVLELAKSTIDTLKTERKIELAKRTSDTQVPDESA